MEKTLLLVDDEEGILSSLTRLFRRDGYRIFRANSGKAALGTCLVEAEQLSESFGSLTDYA